MANRTYREESVLEAARARIRETFDSVERVYISFSGGKDSSVMVHLVMEEAIRRGVKVGLFYIDFEAQYADTIDHIRDVFELYRDHVDPHWVAVPMLLRNAVTNYEPKWKAWDPEAEELWIRSKPEGCRTEADYPFPAADMEFEEFIIEWGRWYGQGKPTGAFIGIRAQESLKRYMTVAAWEKKDRTLNNRRWTTRVVDQVYNVYPIYDWSVEDIWRYAAQYPDKPHNVIYDKMQMAGVPLSQQRLCQPFGDDQRRGLWLYHILEPETWGKLVQRVNGANTGALYVEESGNVSGYNKISKPAGHTWRSYCNLLLQTMPAPTRKHYELRFRKFIYGWNQRGYTTIPEEAPPELEAAQWAPSWRRMCKVLLRNDYWCHGLGQTQPKSEAYQRLMEARKLARATKTAETPKVRPKRKPRLGRQLELMA